jgi:guanylate kinase
LSNASIEIQHSHDFDYIVLNAKIDDAVADVLSIARSEHLATKRFIGDIWENDGQNL